MPVELAEHPGVAIVEGTAYNHDDHGRVRVLLVDDDGVTWEHTERTVGGTPVTECEPEAAFREAATPAPQTVDVPTVDAEATATL